jgi:hypothetical protein
MVSGSRIAAAVLGAAGLLLLCAASVWELREPFSHYVWNTRFEGFAPILPVTAWAALKLWTFWGITTAIASLVLLRIDCGLGLCDAVIGGAAGTWILAYVAGNLLGPIGLFRPLTIWLGVVAAALWVAREPPRLELRAPSAGQKLALLACGLMMVGLLPLQFGSPVPPYMDVLNLPAAVQRILTFKKYLPFDNDPYGYWGPAIQNPGLELFYAFLGFGSGISLGVLSVTAAMVPIAGLIVLATYRLGRSLAGDVAGGMASLAMFATTIFMRAQQMRGTAVTFALVAVGLAFFADAERRPLRTALGALAIATAIASHAIDGGFGFATAAVIVALRLFDDDARNVIREGTCLAAGLLVALPEFAVALQVRLPYPVLPLAQAAGIVAIMLAARGLPPRPERERALGRWLRRVLIFVGLVLVAVHPPGVLHTAYATFPTLALVSVAGLLIALPASNLRDRGGIWVAAAALIVAVLAEQLIGSGWLPFEGHQAQFGLSDVVYKLEEYWCPYFLVFPAAVLSDWLYRNVSPSLAVGALLALVIFPWSQHPELDIYYNEHSLAEEWSVDWVNAKLGWWANSPDRRWVQSPAELRLSEVLRGEIRAGRITTDTHIVHVTTYATSWKDVLLHSVYTGIDDDLYVAEPDSPLDRSAYANGRTHPIDLLPQALASRPPYIVVHDAPPASVTLPPPGYDEIFHDDAIRLFRRASLPSAAAPSLAPH